MDPTLITLTTGCAALAVGSAAVVTCAAVRITRAAKQLSEANAAISAFSRVTYERMQAAVMVGAEAHAKGADLTARIARLSGHDERVTGLLEAVSRYQQEARNARLDSQAYQEVIVHQGDQLTELRAREAERIEELELLETELSATKAALAAEEGQADTWARAATNMGWTPGVAPAAQLGAMA